MQHVSCSQLWLVGGRHRSTPLGLGYGLTQWGQKHIFIKNTSHLCVYPYCTACDCCSLGSVLLHRAAMRWLTRHVGLHLLVAIHNALGQTPFTWSPSELTITPGHYPPQLCTLTNVVLESTDGVFYYNAKTALHLTCLNIDDVWPLKNQPPQSQAEIQCDEEYDIGHIFLIYYTRGSNYYHLHYDMMLPLYRDAYYGKNDSTSVSRVFMPGVETTRLRRIDWETHAFENPDMYWVQMTKVNSATVEPLTNDHPHQRQSLSYDHISCDGQWFLFVYMNPSRATIPLIRPHQCDSEGGRIYIRGVLPYWY